MEEEHEVKLTKREITLLRVGLFKRMNLLCNDPDPKLYNEARDLCIKLGKVIGLGNSGPTPRPERKRDDKP